MSKGHNKKRNTGLMYEFLVRSISQSLVEGNQRSSSTALKIIRRHFKPGSQLHREFRLAQSLVRMTVSSESVASSILREAKSEVRKIDSAALDREKSLLIRDVNHGIADTHFYDRQIAEYRVYATVQQLFDDWRSPSRDLERMARFEDQLVSWMTTPKPKAIEEAVSGETTGSMRLLMKIMMQKINDKYSGVLNEQQKDLIRSYAWSVSSDSGDVLREKLETIKAGLLESIDGFNSSDGDEYTVNQLTETREQLLSEDLNEVNDEVLTRFMLYLKLNDELLKGDDNV